MSVNTMVFSNSGEIEHYNPKDADVIYANPRLFDGDFMHCSVVVTDRDIIKASALKKGLKVLGFADPRIEQPVLSNTSIETKTNNEVIKPYIPDAPVGGEDKYARAKEMLAQGVHYKTIIAETGVSGKELKELKLN